MIIELPNILDKNSCEDIIQFYDEHPDRWQKSDVQERFIDCSMMTHKLVGPVLQSVAALTNRLIIKAAKFYHLEELYLDFQTINRWEAGKDMPLHADNMTPEKEPHWYCGQRDYSSILYLNHNYEGGETIFKYQNQSQPPLQGTAILFPASYGYTHGVNEIKSGTRYTIASWFTTDRKHCVV